jgi:hypothetical protein
MAVLQTFTERVAGPFTRAHADISLNMLRFIIGLRLALNPDLRF